MRIGEMNFVPMTLKSPVRAGGDVATPTAPVPAPVSDTLVLSNPATAPATPPAAPETGFKALSMKVQSFFSNLWESFISPMFTSLLGMFGMGK